MNIGKLLFSLDGRIGRQSFWIGWAVLFVVGFIANMIPGLNLLMLLLMIYPNACLYNKRLHDMGKSGWLQIIPYLAGLVAVTGGIVIFGAAIASAIITASRDRSDPAVLWALLGSMGGFLALIGLAFLVGVAVLVWVGCTPSQTGANQYGAGPEGAPVEDVF
jgi:uncharacterized membrane protein YhaH (DUF805 family)